MNSGLPPPSSAARNPSPGGLLGDAQPVANAGEFKGHQQYFDAL